eukprot:7388137-Prymnesium_polylepis.1
MLLKRLDSIAGVRLDSKSSELVTESSGLTSSRPDLPEDCARSPPDCARSATPAEMRPRSPSTPPRDRARCAPD